MPNPQSVDYQVTDEEVERYRARGYNDDMLPKTAEKRNMGVGNYFTLWMGSVHNIPNYAAVGGFLFLGLSPINVMFALVVSAVLVAAFMVITETWAPSSPASCVAASPPSPGSVFRPTPAR